MKAKRSMTITLIAITTVLLASCNFNIFDGGVTATYKSIPTQDGRYIYARDLKDGSDQKKLEELIPLLKADVDGGFFTGTWLSLAQELLANIYFIASGFSNLAAGLFSNLTSGTSTEDEMIISIADTNGDGTISTEELNALMAVLADVGDAADYLDAAALANPSDSDLQLQNAIAQLASCMDEIINTNPSNPDAAIHDFIVDLSNDGIINDDPNFTSVASELNASLGNAHTSLDNIETYDPNSTNDDFADLLLQLWQP